MIFNLSEAEIKKTVENLKKLEPGFLPFEIFIQVARLTVLTAIEVIPLRQNSENKIEVLLIPREDNDPYWPGQLHTPGTILRPTDQIENFNDAFKRIINGELLFDDFENLPQFVEFNLGGLKRGRSIFVLHFLEINIEPKIGQFYDVNNLPDSIVEEQIPMIEKVVAAYKKYLETK